MTFRGRLVLAATAAVLVVVVLGSLATYLVAYNSLVGSVDVTLSQQAQIDVATRSINNECSQFQAGQCIQVVLSTLQVNPVDGQVLPITNIVKTVASSQGTHSDVYYSTTVNGKEVREIVTALPPGFSYEGNNGPVGVGDGGALQI